MKINVVGTSGSGKSTLARQLAEMARPDAGRRFVRLRSPRQAADFLRALPQVHSSRR